MGQMVNDLSSGYGQLNQSWQQQQAIQQPQEAYRVEQALDSHLDALDNDLCCRMFDKDGKAISVSPDAANNRMRVKQSLGALWMTAMRQSGGRLTPEMERGLYKRVTNAEFSDQRRQQDRKKQAARLRKQASRKMGTPGRPRQAPLEEGDVDIAQDILNHPTMQKTLQKASEKVQYLIRL